MYQLKINNLSFKQAKLLYAVLAGTDPDEMLGHEGLTWSARCALYPDTYVEIREEK